MRLFERSLFLFVIVLSAPDLLQAKFFLCSDGPAYPTSYAKPLAWTLFSVGAADYGITKVAIASGAREINPMMRPLLEHEPAAAIVKLGITAAGAGTLYCMMRDPNKKTRKTAFIGSLILIGIQGWVVDHNIRVTLRLRR